jgi:hypothetical protein
MLKPRASWAPLRSLQEHWLHVLSGSLPVHYNLLTSELPINGLLLTRLPAKFTRHAMYRSLFSNSVMEVGPTDELEIKFSSKFTYRGYRLHFGTKGSDMLLLAMGNNTILDLLLLHLFKDHAPRSFVSDFAH